MGEESLQETVSITNKLGLHARAAASFVQIACKFHSSVRLKKLNNSGWVNGKSILSVMTLSASKGSKIIISVKGYDARQSLERLVELVNDKFGEKE